MQYYFAGWENDSEDIFALMESWWQDTPLASSECNINKEAFRSLFFANKLLCICSRDDEGKLIACFVGAVTPDIYRQGVTKLEQMAACFAEGYRTYSNFTNMLDVLESLCAKLGIDRLGVATYPRMAEALSKRKGYVKDTMNIIKEI